MPTRSIDISDFAEALNADLVVYASDLKSLSESNILYTRQDFWDEIAGLHYDFYVYECPKSIFVPDESLFIPPNVPYRISFYRLDKTKSLCNIDIYHAAGILERISLDE